MRGCTDQPQTKYYHSLTRCAAHALQLCLPTSISLSVLCRENSRIIANTLHLSFPFCSKGVTDITTLTGE